MPQSLIPGFSPYNVPVKPGKRLDALPRAAAEQARGQQQAKTGGRWSQPAVEVRLSSQALAFLGGQGNAKVQQASSAGAAAPASFAAALGASAGAKTADPASAPQAETQAVARYVAPGSTIDILV